MASTLVSPGVEIQERDLTIGSIETVEVNVGAIAGAFSKGPVLKPVRISNESQLIEQFGDHQKVTQQLGGQLQAFYSMVESLMLFEYLQVDN